MTQGIHHITAIATNPQDMLDFYQEILGLKLVKKTVNQDDPQTYHLFFGDKVGSPGMGLTFFTFFPAAVGRVGSGMVSRTFLAISSSKGSEEKPLEFWKRRLRSFNIESTEIHTNEVGDKFIEFEDWDGQRLGIVVTDRLNTGAKLVEHPEIPDEYTIRNFYGAELSVANSVQTETILTEALGYEELKPGVYENREAEFTNLLFLREDGGSRGLNAAGTVHHIAFRVGSEKKQEQVIQKLFELGMNATEQIDRFYFKSVYFREPSGILFEIATDEPGFTVDEREGQLGEKLVLPPFLEEKRKIVEAMVHPISGSSKSSVNFKAKQMQTFKYSEYFSSSGKNIFLLHGTGGDESNLLTLVPRENWAQLNFIGVRGNVSENGMLRFFERESLGNYDQKSIRTEAKKLKTFVEEYNKFRGVKIKDCLFVGLSNGANLIYAASLFYPDSFLNNVLLHPADVLEDVPKLDSNITTQQKYLVSYGSRDQMIPKSESLRLIEKLKTRGAQVSVNETGSGHGLVQEELEVWRGYLDEWING